MKVRIYYPIWQKIFLEFETGIHSLHKFHLRTRMPYANLTAHLNKFKELGWVKITNCQTGNTYLLTKKGKKIQSFLKYLHEETGETRG